MNIFEAEKFIKETYPDLTYTIEFRDNGVKRFEVSVHEGEIEPTCICVANKAYFVLSDGKEIAIPIKNHRYHVPTTEYLTTSVQKPLRLPENKLEHLKCILECEKENIATQAMLDDKALILEDLYANYNQTRENVDAKIQNFQLKEEELNGFKLKHVG